MKRAITVAFIWLVLCSVAAAQSLKTPIDRAGTDMSTMRSLMQKGQVLIIDETPSGDLEMVTAGILIEAPVDKVYQTLIDFDKYREYMPSTAMVKVVDETPEYKDVYYKIQFKFSVLSFGAEYTLRQTFIPNREIRWNLQSSKDNKLKAAYGAYQIFPAPGNRTMLFYSSYTDMKSVSWVVRKAFEAEPSMEISVNASSCVMVLKAVKNRIEKPGYAPNLNK